jgi:mRNA-degrading endonuclease RelE of RelBE toxin-antitoxin system
MFAIEYAEGVSEDLLDLRAHERGRILDTVERQLRFEPTVQTRNRRILVGLTPPWEHVEPIWQLRIGEYRVFYDVDEGSKKVIIRAIRYKPPHRRTEEIL